MVAPRKAAAPESAGQRPKGREERLGKTDFASFHYLEVLVPLKTFLPYMILLCIPGMSGIESQSLI